ncbi:hypothetical protein VTP01DRAFT_1436 [Rhizomucor pusillus]|uniref:uncharacterized protein n=1 Tax=Rhizomucor pusillus TaxID=4840 RepID=UPI003743B7E4
MDYVVDEEQYALETLSSYTQYLRKRTRESDGRSDAMQTDDVKKDVDVRMREASIKRVYTLYTDQDKVRFFKLMFEKVLAASAAAKQLGPINLICVKYLQTWSTLLLLAGGLIWFHPAFSCDRVYEIGQLPSYNKVYDFKHSIWRAINIGQRVVTC